MRRGATSRAGWAARPVSLLLRSPLLVALLLVSLPGPALAQGSDLDAIRAAIRDAHAHWFPADNPVWRLSPAARARLSGAILGVPTDPSIATFRASSRAALPPRLDWRNIGGASYVTGIRNQGGCGSCWAFGATAAFESAFLIQQGTPGQEFDRSEQDVLSCSRGGDCTGGFTDVALSYIVGTGIVDDACFAYVGDSLPCADKCRDWDRRTFKARGIEAVAGDVETLKAALQRGPTTACFTTYEDFNAYGGGVYQHVWGYVTGGHSVELIGYDDVQQAFIAKNSWGDGWGEKGFFRIRYGDSGFGSCALRVLRNEAPRIAYVPSVVVVPGVPLETTIAAEDPDGDALSWDVTGLDALPGPATFDPATATLRWAPPEGTAGTWDVTFRVSDDWAPPGVAQRTVRVSACPAACDDGNPCTDDVCPDGTCRHEFNAAPCAPDGNPCTRDACLDGACQAVEPDGTACDDDGNDCTLDVCRAGACVHEALEDGAGCGDDGSECTADACRGGSCVHDPLPDGASCAADFEVCTIDACRGGACVHDPIPDGEPCDLGLIDACTLTSCQGGTCNAMAAPDGTACDDGRTCTTGDACASGTCQGNPPPACDDGLACTRDGCEDGAAFGDSSESFEDVALSGIDTGIDGDEAAAGPFDIGFGFPLGGGVPRTRFWASTNGLVSFGEAVATGAHGDFPGGPGPKDLVAVYWDDLVCRRDQGCRVAYATLGQAPGRRLVVQWIGAGVYGVPGSALAMEAVLHEDGRIDLRYGDLVGAAGRTAAIGFEDASGRGLAYSVDQATVGPGLSLRYDPAATFTCTILPDKGTCVIGGACLGSGTPHPTDPCLACDGGQSWQAWSPVPGGRCDDGDPCTSWDSCGAAGCAGQRYSCDDGEPCTVDSCDGLGGCVHVPLDGGPCDDGSPCTFADTCVAGACRGSSLRDGTPCDDGRGCTADDACRAGACVGVLPPDCVDGLECTGDRCVDLPTSGGAAAYRCEHPLAPQTCLIDGACRAEKATDPANPCRRCWASDPYRWSPVDGEGCDDGDPCTFGDTCRSGACAGTAYGCPSDDPCWAGACDGSGQCRWSATAAACDDGNPCTADDACRDGTCAGIPRPEGSACDDGRACTTDDRCTTGACRGTAPSACDDGLACTVDGCEDGAGFLPVAGPFEDISMTGAPVGTDSLQPAPMPVAIGFDFPFQGTNRAVAWPSSWGTIRLTELLQKPEDPGDAPTGLCPPDPGLPDGLVAAYWTDLYCDPAEGCSIRWQAMGSAPDRRLLVQWTRARLGSEPQTRLTFQVALFEGGGIELRYLRAVGMNGEQAVAGIQAGTGAAARGARVACKGAWMTGGRGFRYDPGRAFTCRFEPVAGACVVDGSCRADGDVDPANPCRVCRRGEPAWAWSYAACDDGDPCTVGEACYLGDCRGKSRECRPTACQKTSVCDGEGGCTIDPQPAGTSCGGAWCEGDRLHPAPGCDGEGACVAGTARDCSPFACRDGACRGTCADAKDCAAGAWCDTGTGACRGRAGDGSPCTADGECVSGHCGNRFCCPFGDCCASPLDCPAPDAGQPSCTDPAGCQSSFRPATCTKDARCDAGDPVQDDSGCGDTVRQDCGWFLDHACDGTADQPIFACPTSCAADGECDTDARCASAACVPRGDDGASCKADEECTGRHCGAGTCCASGDCCRAAGDCPAGYAIAPVCDQPSRCQGWRGRATCTPRFQCATVREDDDRACGASDGPDCGPYAARSCAGTEDQPFTTCATSCAGSTDCRADATCVAGTCRPLPPTADEGGPSDASGDSPDAFPDALPDADAVDDGGGRPHGSGGCAAGRASPVVAWLLLLLLVAGARVGMRAIGHGHDTGGAVWGCPTGRDGRRTRARRRTAASLKCGPDFPEPVGRSRSAGKTPASRPAPRS